MRRFSIVFCTYLLLSILATGCDVEPKSTIKLGDHVYKVPKQNLFSSSLSRLFEGLGTDEGTPSLHLVFEPEEVKEAIPNFSILTPGSELAGYVRDDLTVLVSSLTDENIRYIESGVHDEEMWRGIKSYLPDRLGPRVVEYDPSVGLYRVYRKQISGSWTFTKLDPETVEGQLPHSNMVVAGCHDTKRVEPSYSCTLSHLRKDIRIEFRIGKTNFVHYEKIIEFIYGKLEKWEVK